MKKVLLFLASALILGAVACNPEKDPQGGKTDDQSKDPGTVSADPSTDPGAEKSKACRILSLKVVSGNVEIEGQIFDEENYIELTYKPEQKMALSNAVATVEISPKATIDPDPATISDWTAPVSLTVTAEDGTPKKEYSVEPAAQQYVVSFAKTTEKTVAAMEAELFAKFGGNLHAFCSTDKFADCGGNVFDLNLSKIGTLNMEGVGEGVIVSMSNDDNGVLVAAIGYAAEDWTGTPAEAAELVSTKIFAWRNGYDSAPEEIYSNAGNVSQYMSVNGDINGEMYAFAYTDGRTGQHHTWTFHNGVVDKSGVWRWFDTKILDNRWGDSCGGDQTLEYFYASAVNGGLSSGQSVSGLEMTPGEDGKPEGGIYFFTSAAPEWDGGTGGAWWRAAGAVCYVRNGIDGKDVAVPGSLASPLIENELKHGGPQHYGNTDYPAGIKAFNFSGHHYAAIAHTGVVNIYFTLQNLDYYLGDTTDPQYVQESIQGLETALTHSKGSVAYVFNPAKDEGYVLASYLAGPQGDATQSGGYRLYTLTREELK